MHRLECFATESQLRQLASSAFSVALSAMLVALSAVLAAAVAWSLGVVCSMPGSTHFLLPLQHVLSTCSPTMQSLSLFPDVMWSRTLLAHALASCGRLVRRAMRGAGPAAQVLTRAITSRWSLPAVWQLVASSSRGLPRCFAGISSAP